MFFQHPRFALAAVPAWVLLLAVPAHAEWENARSVNLTVSLNLPIHLEVAYCSNGALAKVGIEQSQDGETSIRLVDPSLGQSSAAAIPWTALRMGPGETVKLFLDNPEGSTLTVVMFRLGVVKPDGSRIDLGQVACQFRGSGAGAKLVTNDGPSAGDCRLRAHDDDTLELGCPAGITGAGGEQASAGSGSRGMDADAASTAAGAARGAGAGDAGSKRKPDRELETCRPAKRARTRRPLDPAVREEVHDWMAAQPAAMRYPSEKQRERWGLAALAGMPDENEASVRKKLMHLLVNLRQRLPEDAESEGEESGEVEVQAEGGEDPRGPYAEARRWTLQMVAAENAYDNGWRNVTAADKQRYMALAAAAAKDFQDWMREEAEQEASRRHVQAEQRQAQEAKGGREHLSESRGYGARRAIREGLPVPIPRAKGIARYTAYSVFIKERTAAGEHLSPHEMSRRWNAVSPERKREYKQQAHLKTRSAHDQAALAAEAVPFLLPAPVPAMATAGSAGAGSGSGAAGPSSGGAGTAAASAVETASFALPYVAYSSAGPMPFFSGWAPAIGSLPVPCADDPFATVGELGPIPLARGDFGSGVALPSAGTEAAEETGGL